MPSCSVFNCKNKSQTSNLQKDNTTFHLFPKEPCVRTVWVKACGNHQSWLPKRTSTICSQHFDASSLYAVPGNKRRRLKQGSIPMFNLTVPSTSKGPISDCSHTLDTKSEKVVQETCQLMSTGFNCKECGKEMFGFRLKCIECFEYEMCGDCEGKGTHSEHYILQVPAHKPQEEAEQLVKILRQELELEIPEEPEIKTEIYIKEEIIDPLEQSKQIEPFSRPHPDNPMEQPMLKLNIEGDGSAYSFSLERNDAPVISKVEQASQLIRPPDTVTDVPKCETYVPPTQPSQLLSASQPSASKRSAAPKSSPAPKRQAITLTAIPRSQDNPKITIPSCQVTSRSVQGVSKTFGQSAGSHGQNKSAISQPASSQAAAKKEDSGSFSFAVFSHSHSNAGKAKEPTVKKKS